MFTRSICPVCYKEIPADVAIGDHVYMVKVCLEHGLFTGMVERDPKWYLKGQQARQGEFLPGYIVDVTSRCNMACPYCFHDRGEDRPADEIVEDARNANIFPVYLSGGEPTLHPDLPSIVKRIRAFSSVWIITNGTRLTDEEYLYDLCAAGLCEGSMVHIAPSFHGPNNEAIETFLSIMRDRKAQIGTAYWVVDELAQIDEAVAMMQKWRDVIGSMRIKAASCLWMEQKPSRKMFVSDMLGYMGARHPSARIREDLPGNKTSLANVEIDGMLFMLVSWYDRLNVDLDDINCGPWYRARNGEIHNLVTSCLINEGMTR